MSKLDERQKTERAIIGCMLLEDKPIDIFIGMGGDETWFSGQQTRRVIREIVSRYSNNKVVGSLEVERNTDSDSLWVEGCIDIAVTPAHVEHYITVLKGYAALDRARSMADSLKALAGSTDPESYAEVMSWIDNETQRIQFPDRQETKSLSEGAAEWVEEMTKPESHQRLLDWPLESITRTIGRLDSEVVWLCSMPSQGKTSLATQWLKVLAGQGLIASLASLETPMNKMYQRLIAQNAPMNTFNLRQGRFTKDELEKARAAAKQLSPNMRISHVGRMTLDRLLSWARAEHRAGSQMLIIDNTRWIKVPRADSRVGEVAEISTRIKEIRDELMIPVVMLHHSRLDAHGKEDASWSSDIRRDTDIMLFLRKNEELSGVVSPYGAPRLCSELYVEKNRDGDSAVGVMMEFNKKHLLFHEWV